MELMRGYILYNKNGSKLTHNLVWSDQENAGWLWDEDEVRGILEELANWENKPAFYQYCALIKEEDGDVNIRPLEEAEEF